MTKRMTQHQQVHRGLLAAAASRSVACPGGVRMRFTAPCHLASASIPLDSGIDYPGQPRH